MSRVQPRLTIALLFTALILLTFFGTAFISAPIDFLYRQAVGLSSARNVAQIAALLAVVGIFITGFIIAIPTALQPSGIGRKLLYVLPGYFLAFTLVGILSARVLGVGTVGTLLTIQGIGPATFAQAWVALGVVLSTITIVIAAARVALSGRTLKIAVATTAITGVLSLVATVAMIASVAIVSTSQPSRGFGGPGGQFPGNGQGAPGGNTAGQGASTGIKPPSGFTLAQSTPAPGGASSQNPAGQNAPGGAPAQNGQGASGGASSQNPAATSEAPSGSPQGQNAAGAPGSSSAGQNAGGAPGGQGGQFPPGGPGGFGGTADAASHFELGGVLMAIFAVVALIGVVGAVPALRQSTVAAGSASQVTPRNYRREFGLALVGVVGVTLILAGVSQLGQVSHQNPPIQSSVKWDSQQTQDLASRACMSCHSNETVWPWYSYIAPASWLTSLHVTQGRQQFDLSELNNLPASRKANLAHDMAEQIRSGTMPPKDYLLLHPEARLTDAEQEQLIQGLEASIPNS